LRKSCQRDRDIANVAGDGQGGTLYVTATPIGNLQDISQRAIDVLSSAELIAAEDTRRTRILLTHLGISARLISCREHNEADSASKIVGVLESGRDVALVTDAGTPALSDPGRRVVQTVRRHGLGIVPVPGPSAITAALSVSGMPADRFHFEGFLPPRKGARCRRLDELALLDCTLVFFEAPHRLVSTLGDMLCHLGDRETFMARELTKLHETLEMSKISVLLEQVSLNGVKGEITLVVKGAESTARRITEDMHSAFHDILSGMVSGGVPTKQAAMLLSTISGLPKRTFYEMALSVKGRHEV